VNLFARRKPRDWGALAADPNAALMVGRLLGMNELAIRLLADVDNPSAKIVAESLERIVPWFMEDAAQDKKALPPAQQVPHLKQPTP
jgi:hypothetical protein